MNEQLFWFLARASGITAYLLISAAMIAGIVLKSRPFGAALKAPIALDVHRFITTLAFAAIGVHGLALVADSTVEITFGDLVIPFTAPYNPLWTGLGVIAADLAVIVAASVSVPQATPRMLDTINRTLTRDVAIQPPIDAVGSKRIAEWTYS